MVLLVAVGLSRIDFGFCQTSGQQDQTNELPLLTMPQEYLNYTVTEVNGALWAVVDGVYPMHLSNITFLPMVYPTPPGTTNMHIKLDGTELSWINYSDIDPTDLHYTDIGNWQMVYCVINPSAQDFVLQIHYEHPIQIINGSFTFLYDLNIDSYLSPSSPNSTAHFRVQLPSNTTGMKVFTTGFEGKWTSKDFNSTKTDQGETVTFSIVSKYAEPLLGDIAFVLNGNLVPEFSEWAVLSCVTFASLAVIPFYVKYIRPKNACGHVHHGKN